MATGSEELELMIDDYVDGRLEGRRRDLFETRLKSDAELRRKVETATQSIKMLRQFLGNVGPSDSFEDKVSSQIISITQSNQHLNPAVKGTRSGKLTAADPDARLLHDPEAAREKRRLMWLAAAAAVLFAAAVAAIAVVFVGQGDQGNRKPPAPMRSK